MPMTPSQIDEARALVRAVMVSPDTVTEQLLCDHLNRSLDNIAELQAEVERLRATNRALDNQLLEQGYDGP